MSQIPIYNYYRNTILIVFSLLLIGCMYVGELLFISQIKTNSYSGVWLQIFLLSFLIAGYYILQFIFTQKLDFFSPINIFIFIIALMYVVYPSLLLMNDYKPVRVYQHIHMDLGSNLAYLQRAIAYATFAGVSFVIGYKNPLTRNIAKKMPVLSFKPAKGETKIYVLVFGIGVLCWLIWMDANGGIGYLAEIFTNSAGYRRGQVLSRMSVLRWAFLVCLVAPLLIYMADNGRAKLWTVGFIVLGLVITASRSMSVSEIALFLINFLIVFHYYRKNLRLVWLVLLFLLFLMLIMVLKFSYNISGNWSISNFINLLDIAFESASSTIYFTLRNKFMGADVFSVILRYVPSEFPYIGPEIFFQVFWNILPMGSLDILPQFATVGNQLAKEIMGIEQGGHNPTFLGLLYMCAGFSGIIWGPFLYGSFWSVCYRYFLLHKHNRWVMFAYITSLTYIMIFFVRVGGPTITFQRYTYVLVIGFASLAFVVLVRGIKRERALFAISNYPK